MLQCDIPKLNGQLIMDWFKCKISFMIEVEEINRAITIITFEV